MNGRRVGRALLTVTAGIGVTAVVLALLGVFLGVKPLLFRSGSMGPAIPAGGFALARPVHADQIRTGDVVSVINAAGTRVTHRVVAVDPQADGTALLTLRGDANPVADSEKYPVRKADRVFFSVPWVGYVIAFLNAPLGIFLLGGFAVALCLFAFRKTARTGRHRRGPGTVAAVAVLAAATGVTSGTTGTMALFTDSGTITTAAFASGSLANPVALATSSNCSASNALLGSTITLNWTGVTPAALPLPQLPNYEYELRFLDRNNNNAVVSTLTQPHTGAAASQQSYQNSASTLGGLLGLNLASQNRITTQIYTHLKGTRWYGSTPVSINWTVTTILGVATFTCNA